jgi:hypothetical protein
MWKLFHHPREEHILRVSDEKGLKEAKVSGKTKGTNAISTDHVVAKYYCDHRQDIQSEGIRQEMYTIFIRSLRSL